VASEAADVEAADVEAADVAEEEAAAEVKTEAAELEVAELEAAEMVEEEAAVEVKMVEMVEVGMVVVQRRWRSRRRRRDAAKVECQLGTPEMSKSAG
jgi:hypothetical protein